MRGAVRVRATVTGHRRRGVQEHELTLALAPGPVTARQVIEAAVTAEVAALRPGPRRRARCGHSQTSRSWTTSTAAVRMGDTPPPGPIDRAAAVEAALLAFSDGIFKVLVGDHELKDTDPVDLTDGADVLFLRLLPLGSARRRAMGALNAEEAAARRHPGKGRAAPSPLSPARQAAGGAPAPPKSQLATAAARPPSARCWPSATGHRHAHPQPGRPAKSFSLVMRGS